MKVKQTRFFSMGNRINMFEVNLRDNLGNPNMIMLEADDELDAWRKAYTHIKEME
jgi:hypothetical protein